MRAWQRPVVPSVPGHSDAPLLHDTATDVLVDAQPADVARLYVCGSPRTTPPTSATRHVPCIRHAAARLARRRLRGSLRAERHGCRRPAARAGGGHRRRLARTRRVAGRAVPHRHGGAAHPAAERLRRRHRGDRRDRSGGRAQLADAGLAYAVDTPGRAARPSRASAEPISTSTSPRPRTPRLGTWATRATSTAPRCSSCSPRAAATRTAPASATRSTRCSGARPARASRPGRPGRRRPPGLAHRVLGHRAQGARHRLHRAGRRKRPDLPAPRHERRPCGCPVWASARRRVFATPEWSPTRARR